MRHVTKIGNIYEVVIGESHKRFFQFIGRDTANLNSDVIRIFNHLYLFSENPSVDCIINDKIDCYMHTSVHAGVKFGKWKHVGKSSNIGDLNIYFRTSDDYGFFPRQKIISYHWTVWEMSGERIRVGKLPRKYYDAPIGMIYSPDSVVYRVEHQQYSNSFYPDYK